jgi:hypothetical protein
MGCDALSFCGLLCFLVYAPLPSSFPSSRLCTQTLQNRPASQKRIEPIETRKKRRKNKRQIPHGRQPRHLSCSTCTTTYFNLVFAFGVPSFPIHGTNTPERFPVSCFFPFSPKREMEFLFFFLIFFSAGLFFLCPGNPIDLDGAQYPQISSFAQQWGDASTNCFSISSL